MDQILTLSLTNYLLIRRTQYHIQKAHLK